MLEAILHKRWELTPHRVPCSRSPLLHMLPVGTTPSKADTPRRIKAMVSPSRDIPHRAIPHREKDILLPIRVMFLHLILQLSSG
jgi:hypothetical protein